MDSVQKFQDLLKRLFQFETSDLDFGIYRILNYKRGQLEKFIQEDLKNLAEHIAEIRYIEPEFKKLMEI